MMSTSNFEELVERVQSLSADERRQLQELLSQSVTCPAVTEDEFEKSLIANGVLAPNKKEADASDWTPVVIQGEPLSHTVLKDRR